MSINDRWAIGIAGLSGGLLGIGVLTAFDLLGIPFLVVGLVLLVVVLINAATARLKLLDFCVSLGCGALIAFVAARIVDSR